MNQFPIETSKANIVGRYTHVTITHNQKTVGIHSKGFNDRSVRAGFRSLGYGDLNLIPDVQLQRRWWDFIKRGRY